MKEKKEERHGCSPEKIDKIDGRRQRKRYFDAHFATDTCNKIMNIVMPTFSELTRFI
jgi:hypothetical protein